MSEVLTVMNNGAIVAAHAQIVTFMDQIQATADSLSDDCLAYAMQGLCSPRAPTVHTGGAPRAQRRHMLRTLRLHGCCSTAAAVVWARSRPSAVPARLLCRLLARKAHNLTQGPACNLALSRSVPPLAIP